MGREGSYPPTPQSRKWRSRGKFHTGNEGVSDQDGVRDVGGVGPCTLIRSRACPSPRIVRDEYGIRTTSRREKETMRRLSPRSWQIHGQQKVPCPTPHPSWGRCIYEARVPEPTHTVSQLQGMFREKRNGYFRNRATLAPSGTPASSATGRHFAASR